MSSTSGPPGTSPSSNSRWVRQSASPAKSSTLAPRAWDSVIPPAYQILKDASTTAIFRVESDGMKNALEKARSRTASRTSSPCWPSTARPLGSGMVDDNHPAQERASRRSTTSTPTSPPACRPPMASSLYREPQVQISQIIGGYTLGGADVLRQAMGKKKPEEMARHRGTIAAGAGKGLRPGPGRTALDLMTKFAECGSSKSHTAAYPSSPTTAWLKAHHCRPSWP